MAINILKAEQVKALSYTDAKKSLNDGGGLRIILNQTIGKYGSLNILLRA